MYDKTLRGGSSLGSDFRLTLPSRHLWKKKIAQPICARIPVPRVHHVKVGRQHPRQISHDERHLLFFNNNIAIKVNAARVAATIYIAAGRLPEHKLLNKLVLVIADRLV